MSLTASPRQAAVVDLFVLREVSLSTPPVVPTPGGILSQRDLAEQFTRERITVPELAGGFMRLVSIKGGFIGSVHVAERTLTLFGAGAGAPVTGEVWDNLVLMGGEMQVEYQKLVRGPVPASWGQRPKVPTGRPWLAFMPMDGMAWYGEHAPVIVQLMRETALYFIGLGAICRGN